MVCPKENALGYVRRSRLKSAELQMRAIEQYCNEMGLSLVDFFVDEENAAELPFAERPAGAALCSQLQPGTHIVAASIGLVFASTAGWLAMFREWSQQAITCHIVRVHGKPLVSCAEMVSMMPKALDALNALKKNARIEATRNALYLREYQGLRYTNYPGYGFLWWGKKGEQMRTPDPVEREVIACIREWRELGHSLDTIRYRLWMMGVKTRNSQRWSRSRVYRALLANSKNVKTPVGPCD
jgi:DNA invertase Pin-like site-specific DNA recombinase